MILKKKRKGEQAQGLPGWIVSYGDLVTTLLCFFITLSALAEDQTGVNLHAGLDSFRNRPLFPDLAGLFNYSSRTVPLQSPSPSTVPDELAKDKKVDSKHNNLIDEGEEGRVIDLEEEQFQRFLSELNRQFQLEKTPSPAGIVTIDVFEPVEGNGTSVQLGPQGQATVWQVLPLLASDSYHVSVTVWATMPSESAWLRATRQAVALVDTIRSEARLQGAARSRIQAAGQPWRYPHRRRPVWSIVVTRR